jgi:ElaB/YqjD/DUF883 family membrane-anchored ribosome-binding protein
MSQGSTREKVQQSLQQLEPLLQQVQQVLRQQPQQLQQPLAGLLQNLSQTVEELSQSVTGLSCSLIVKKPDIDHRFEQIYEELAIIKNSAERVEQHVGHLAAAIVRNVNSQP